MARRQRREYPRTARLNELFREVLSEALVDLEEEWTDTLSITGVSVDNDLFRARVFFDCLDGPDGDEQALADLSAAAPRLRRYLADHTSTRRTPELVFEPDPGVRGGEHIERLLQSMSEEGDRTAGGDTNGDDGS